LGDHLAYRDPGYAEGAPQFGPLITALKRDGKAILTTDDVLGNKGKGKLFRRTGYVGLYRVSNVRVIDDALCFDIATPPIEWFR
jgi:hypothetical protein